MFTPVYYKMKGGIEPHPVFVRRLHVSNIYKYYFAYSTIIEQAQRRAEN